jgi:hypothetical protein
MEAAEGRETGEEGGEGEMMGGGRKGLGDAFGSGRRRRRSATWRESSASDQDDFTVGE